MVTEVLFTVLLLLFIYVLREFYILPNKKMKFYAQIFHLQGYRVLKKPYHFFHNQFYEENQKPALELGDTYKVIRQQYSKYDVVVTNAGNQPIVEILDPSLIKSYFDLDKHYSYPKVKILADFVSMVIGEGLIFSEGNQWKRKRTILNRLFNFDFLKSQTTAIAEICEKTLQKFETNVEIDELGKKYFKTELLNGLIQVASKVVFKTFLGLDTDDKLDGVYLPEFLTRLISEATLLCYQTVGLIFGTRFIKLGIRAKDRDFNRRNKLYKDWALQAIKKRTGQIQDKLSNTSNKNVVASDIIQAFFIEKLKNESSITSDQEIFNEFSNFLFAGTDTTSHFLEAMISFIAANPQVEAKVRDQISKYMSTDDYSYDNLKKMAYIDNVQKQTNRIYGPTAYLFWRLAKQDNFLKDIPIKKGTILSVLYSRNHLSQQFFVKPSQFRPERWQTQCNNLPSYIMNGFSSGARSCIGKHLALLQSKILLIKLFKRYERIVLPKKNFGILVQFLITIQKMEVKLYPREIKQ